jgi:hypothetical protein
MVEEAVAVSIALALVVLVVCGISTAFRGKNRSTPACSEPEVDCQWAIQGTGIGGEITATAPNRSWPASAPR